MPTICLNMIVKNESRIITRLLDSVVQYIDSYCICDTGSSDNTPMIIEDYFNAKQIPGKVFSEPFQNFEYNRTFALEQCKSSNTDYVLLLWFRLCTVVKSWSLNAPTISRTPEN